MQKLFELQWETVHEVARKNCAIKSFSLSVDIHPFSAYARARAFKFFI